jgi:leader peptidase (prepilin peptidase)/N-methyltransferase
MSWDATTLGVLLAAPFVGSFLGTLVLRLPQRQPVALARSACPACGHRLGVRDLLPLIGRALLRGRCRYCGAPIARFYPAMELAALGVALWAWTEAAGAALIASCLLGWGLLVLAIIDRRHFLLPDAVTLPLIGLGLLATAVLDAESLAWHALGAAAGYLGFAGLAALYRRLRGEDGLGLGDAKLLAAGGAWLGPAALPGAVLAAALLALGEALLRRLLAGEALHARLRIAFGAPLALGLWLVWLYGPPLAG